MGFFPGDMDDGNCVHFAELAPELDKKYKKLYTKDKLGSIFAIFKYSHFDTFNNSNNA